MADLQRTQHFTRNHDKILSGIDFSPTSAVDPFAGKCDLANHFPNTSWELYDIDVKDGRVIANDSLLNPIDYSGKTVITNPPYLAKNKTKEFKEIFKKYGTDDLYKASILSIMGCENGILIIPVNFFTDENTGDVRKKFLSEYKVRDVNVFNKPVFENTTYNICSFYFEKGQTNEVSFHNIDNGEELDIILDDRYDYRLGGEFYAQFKDVKPVFFRLRTEPEESYLTSMFLTALDKRNEPINLSYNGEPYYGKNTDRIYATIITRERISDDTERALIESFNSFLKENRLRYKNMILTNYRDFGRKRISFDDAYKILTMLYHKTIS